PTTAHPTRGRRHGVADSVRKCGQFAAFPCSYASDGNLRPPCARRQPSPIDSPVVDGEHFARNFGCNLWSFACALGRERALYAGGEKFANETAFERARPRVHHWHHHDCRNPI